MTIRLGVAGVRHPHIDAILTKAEQRAGVELTCIAESDRELRASYAGRYQLREYDDHTQLLHSEAVDAIAVADVFTRRGRIIADALGSGVHVLTDKPMCTTRSDLDAIHVAWRDSGRLLSIAFEKRFMPPTLALFELLDAGELGEIAMVTSTGPHKLTREQRPDWMFHAASYGGILNDLVVHDIDLLLRLTGARSGTVRGHAGNRGHGDRPDFEDHGLAVIQVDDGALASLDAHWLSPEAAPYFGDIKMCVTGLRGTADVLWKDNRLVAGTHHRPPEEVPLPGKRTAADDFFDALLAGREPSVTATDSLTTTSVALTAQESARVDRPLDWSVDVYRRKPDEAYTG